MADGLHGKDGIGMKLGAIKRCCVEENEFYIYRDINGEQWIGTHTAAWPVEGDLELTEGSIAAIFDLAPKKAAQMDILALRLTPVCSTGDRVGCTRTWHRGIFGRALPTADMPRANAGRGYGKG